MTAECFENDDRLFGDVVSNMHLVAITLNTEAVLTYCNDYFLTLTGWSRAEVMGSDWFEWFIPQEYEDVPFVFAGLLKDLPETWYYENEILCKSQERVLIRWNNSVLKDKAGNVVGVASIGEDITEYRLLERKVLEASARERRHLAGELHDGLGQQLFGARLLVQSAQTKAYREGLSISTDLAQVAVVLGNLLDNCRRIAYGMSPLGDTSGGIVQALRELTKLPDQFEPSVKLSIVEAAPLRVDAITLDHIYRFAQEAFANALKHAAATRIDVRLNVNRTEVVLTVEDNGIGLPRDAVRSKQLGIRLMRYRARSIRGSVIFAAGEPSGTIVTLRCPQGDGSIGNTEVLRRL